MKASSGTSAKATAAAQPTVQSSARPRPTPTSADGIALSGPSNLPDPRRNAFRKDLADVALASQVIASHYAEPVSRTLRTGAPLRDGPGADAAVICELEPGARFSLLDDSLGWAWGYAGEERLVGYVASDALTAV